MRQTGTLSCRTFQFLPGRQTYKQFIVVAVSESLSHVWLFVTPWIAASQASPFFSISQSLPKLHWWCHPAISSSEALFSFCFSVFPSIRDFSSETAVCIRWPKYWSFSFSISPSNEYSGLISLKIDWFDLFAVQGTFWSLLQHQSLKASILRCSGNWR